jgi:hypothetical protein
MPLSGSGTATEGRTPQASVAWVSGPLGGWRVLGVGDGPVLDAAGELLESLGTEFVVVPRADAVAPELLERFATAEPLGALTTVAGLESAPFPVVRIADPWPDRDARWAASGLMALTGKPDGPWWGPPGGLVERLLGAGAVLQLLAAVRGVSLDVDPLALLTERASITGFRRNGPIAVGGSLVVLRTRDSWVAVNLARADDRELLTAWLEGAVDPGDWTAFAAHVATRSGSELVAQGSLLGLPIALEAETRTPAAPWRVLERAGAAQASHEGIEEAAQLASNTERRRLRIANAHPGLAAGPTPLVVDLSSLWAGPLTTRLLLAVGARVVKVESRSRPDGARRGPAAFFDLMHAGKESVALDLTDDGDLTVLRGLLARADLVIEGSRPRAMAALGIDPFVVAARGATWLGITGHGRVGAAANRVAFGDDAAFAAGLTVDEPPTVVGDAIADPIAGLYAAVVGTAALVGGRGQVIDVALAAAAAFAGFGPHAVPCSRYRAVEPAVVTVAGSGPPLGLHTDAWRAVVNESYP